MNKELLGFQKITKEVSQNIHEYLYSVIKLADQDKATLIAGILIALANDSFRDTYKQMTNENQFIDNFMSAIKYSIYDFKGLKNKHEAIISNFDFIKNNDNFKKVVEKDKKVIALQFLTEIIEKSIYKIAKEHPSYDIMGEFYNEFSKYSTSDQQSLGIVLTPHHIADFMSELLEIEEKDVIMDTCAGTSSLLLTAKAHGRENKVLAVEYNSRMLSLTVANMIIKKIDSDIYLGDSFDPNILNELKKSKPNKLIINPPYAQDGYPELEFALKGLNILEKGGLGVIILPKGITLTTKQKNIKKEILEKHTLKAVLSMPQTLFTESGVDIATVIMLFEAHKSNIDKTILIDVKNDGYKMLMREGRIDIDNKWFDIKNNVKDVISMRKEINNFSTLIEASENIEWNIDAYLKTDINKINDNSFINNLRNYIFYKNNILLDGNTQVFISSILDFLENNNHLKESSNSNKILLSNINLEEFLYSDIFNIGKGRGPTQKSCKDIEGKTLYISATDNNNGMVFKTGVNALHNGRNITVSDFGKAFYQDQPFVGSHIVVLTPKEDISKEAMFFILTMIEKDKEKYSFSRSFSLSKIKDEKILLPINDKGNPDWQLMEDYIKSLPYSKYL